MAAITNAFQTYQAKGNREDLHDFISMITPEETPFRSLCNEKPVDATHTEWQTDTLATPSLTNYNVQAAEYNYSARTPTSRVGNYTQIFHTTGMIAETQEVVDKAGRKSEVGYQKAKMGQEHKIDQEITLISNQASTAGSASVPPKLGGFRAWLASNDDLGSGGASGGYNSSTSVVDAATNGTQRAFTKTLLDNNIEATYKAGGNPSILMVSPYVKRVFSTIMNDSNVSAFRTPVSGSPGTIVGAADAYVSDFGTIDVVPNRQMARFGASIARNAFLIDTGKVHCGFLRRISQDKQAAKTGDAVPIVIKSEMTLIVDNEAASGVIADLYGMTSAS